MTKKLILYYSKTGNSKFIAEKLSKEMPYDIDIIKPWFDSIGFLFLISLLNIPIPVTISKNKLRPYQEIILIGPIWGGLLISPLRSVLKKCLTLTKPVHFAVTCESKESDKDTKYGYNQVLIKVKQMGGDLVKSTTAFSTSLVSDYDGKIEIDIYKKSKITSENFSEALKHKFDEFKNLINTSTPMG